MAKYSVSVVGNKLRSLRISCNVTQSDIVDLLGIPWDTYLSYEDGVVPSFEHALALANFYATDVTDLFLLK